MTRRPTMRVMVKRLVPPDPRLRFFIDTIGEQATLDLVRAFGGRQVYIPLGIREGTVLAGVIGEDRVRKLARAIDELARTSNGRKAAQLMRPTIPFAKSWHVMLLHAMGKNWRDIVAEVRVDRSSVYRILKDKDRDHSQFREVGRVYKEVKAKRALQHQRVALQKT